MSHGYESWLRVTAMSHGYVAIYLYELNTNEWEKLYNSMCSNCIFIYIHLSTSSHSDLPRCLTVIG